MSSTWYMLHGRWVGTYVFLYFGPKRFGFVRNPTPAFARTAQHRHTSARPGCQNRKQDWSCFFFATNSHRVTIAFCPPLQGQINGATRNLLKAPL